MKKTGTLFFFIFCLFFLRFSELGWTDGLETAVELQEAFIDVSEKVGPAVVSISTLKVRSGILSVDPYLDEFLRQFFGSSTDEKIRSGLGSGVIIDAKGYILTNQHVVANADEIEVSLPDGRKFSGVVTGADSRLDLAVVKIDAEDLPVAKLGDSDAMKTGQWAIAIGNPFGHLMADPQPTLTVGVVSALHRALPNALSRGTYYGDLIQTDAAINQGNSGGPLVNIQGEVIGINTAILSPSGASAGLGFAIPTNLAKVILDNLKEGKEASYGWVGIWIQPITKEVAEQLELKRSEGVLVYRVESKSPADKVGLKAGDVIVSLNGKKIRDTRELVRYIFRLKPGTQADLTYFRKGKEIEATIVIGERRGEGGFRHRASAIRTETVQWRGVVVEELPEEAKEEWGPETQGVFVSGVKEGSPAYLAGIRPGDVIDEMNKKKVLKLKDFYNVIKSTKKEVLVHTQRGYFVVK